MLKVFYGNDLIKVRQAAFALANSFEAEGVRIENIDSDNYQTGIYADAAGGASLFGQETVYVIDTPSSNAVWYEDTIENLEVLAESNNTFILIEGTLLAPEKKKFTKYASSLEEFKATPGERFNTFALADALANKDKKSLWLLLNEALLNGIAVEEIAGVLWWQLKALRLASLTKTASEAGMKDYPYNKAKRSLSKYKAGELESLSNSLITLQHESRLGRHDFTLALEKWVLSF